ncbi:DUF3987 domain-containing protein [Microcystis wesenbergii]|uniref:DUF3987 domain-containing protein n=1 Tax=Microcystis wesenbergii TaxID=44823 RepID=UPI00167FFF32|nr:DUF3987 domain-containing protein [Microcystis wesenbergii]MBD2118159.1 DUF3987 domain-containing protein [Microcystis wesenbergii FACHB-1339]
MLKAFNRCTPCPICGEASPDCRYSPDGELVLCHSHTDFDPQHPEWHYVRVSSNGVWGVFVPRKDKDFDRTEWEAKKAERERDRREREHAKNALSIPDRDKALRKLSKTLGLSRQHQKALLDRGLSESQIETGLFFSISPNKPVPADIPTNLPGIADGKISAASNGIACLAFDGEGRAIGYQVRLDNATDSKYRWAKGVESSHLPNIELPVTHIPNGKDNGQVWLTEGILKPFVAAHKHGINVMGAAGGNFSGSPNQIKDAVGPYKELILCPDAGDINNHHVMLRWEKQIIFLESLGKSLLVAWWGQKTKDGDDIDELSDLNGIEFIECTKFLAMGEKMGMEPQKTEKSTNVVTHPRFNPKPLETDKLEEIIDNLIIEGLSGSKLKIELASIAKQYGISDQRINEIYKERVEENDHDLDKEDLYSDLDNIVKAKNQGIDLNRVLPKSIATPILHHAKITGLRPEAYLLSLLTGLGCCHHPDTALELLDSSDWKTAPNLYSCIVAPSGTGKSIIARTVIEKPLKALSERDDAEYKAKMKEYKQSLKNPDSDMEKPVRRIRYFSGGTNEGIGRYAALNPDKGMLLNRDELSGLFKSANMYRGGRGSDSEEFLEWYDGTAKINLRADPDKTVICRKILLSIFGTIQPAILEKLLGDQQDSSGQWARFLFCQLPEVLALLDVDAPKIDITPVLSHLYESLDQLPPNYYRFNRPALIKFIDAVNEYKKKAFKEQKPALKNVYRKIQESIGKIALNLHIVWSLADSLTPSLTIPEDIVDMAIELADFFVHEVKSLQTVMADDLPSHYARILSCATDWISAGKLRAAAFNTKTRQQYPTTRINEICGDLTDRGFGEIRYSIRGSIEFRAFNRDSNLTKIDSVDSSLTKVDSIVNPPKPLPDKDYSMKVDSVDSKIDFSVETTNPLIEDHTVTPHNLKSDYLLNSESTESTESNLDKETQSQQGFIKVDNPKSSESTLVNLVKLESPQDSDRPVGDTDNLKPGGECIYKKNGRAHGVISVDGDQITIQDWYEENPPFTVAIDEVLLDTPGLIRQKKKKAK